MTDKYRIKPGSLRPTPLAACLAVALSLAPGSALAAHERPGLTHVKPNHDAATQLHNWLAEHPESRQRPTQNLGSTVHIVENCNNSGPGSLRDTIAMAADGDTVDMLLLDCSVIVLDNDLTIEQDNLALVADGSTIITLAPSGTRNGIITHLGTGELQLTGLVLADGEYEITSDVGSGGCVYSRGRVFMHATTLQNCKVTNHDGSAYGGAVWASQGLSMEYSVIAGSAANAGPNGQGAGGAVFAYEQFSMYYSSIDHNTATGGVIGSAGGVWAQGATTISRSTISRNTAQNVGGIAVTISAPSANDIAIRHSTISGNASSGHPDILVCGGGMFLRTPGDIRLENNTISNNYHFADESLGVGLCVEDGGGSIVLKSNIISGNTLHARPGETTLAPPYTDLHIINNTSGITTIQGDHNLIGYIGAHGPYAIPADTIRDFDTPLRWLGDHGGPTSTMPIGTGSWAFNRGDYVSPGSAELFPNTDQRLLPRSVGAGVDIGAYESDALFIGRFEDPPEPPITRSGPTPRASASVRIKR